MILAKYEERNQLASDITKNIDSTLKYVAHVDYGESSF